MLNIPTPARMGLPGLVPSTALLLLVLLFAPLTAHASQLTVTAEQPADRWMNPLDRPKATFDVMPTAGSGGTTAASTVTLRGDIPDGTEQWDGYYRFSRVFAATMSGTNYGGATCAHVINSNIATCNFPVGFVGPAKIIVDVSPPHSYVEFTSVAACEEAQCEALILGSRTPGSSSLSIQPGPNFPSSIVPGVTTKTSVTIHNAGTSTAELVVLEPVKLGPIDVQLWSSLCAGTATGLCQLAGIPAGASVEVPVELHSSVPAVATAPTIAIRVHTKGDGGIDQIAAGAESLALGGRAAWSASVAATSAPLVPQLQRGAKLTRAGLLRTGAQTRIHCPAACQVTSRLTAPAVTLRRLHLRSATLGTGKAGNSAEGPITAVTHLSTAARRRVTLTHGRVSLTHVLTVTCGGRVTKLTESIVVTL